MKKFVIFVALVVIVTFSVNFYINYKNQIVINYARLDTRAYNYGSTVYTTINKAFPQKTIDLIIEALPELRESMNQFQDDINYIKENKDQAFLSSDTPVLALRYAKKTVGTEEYMGLIEDVFGHINPKLVSKEDYYTLWKFSKRDCQKLRKVIPTEIRLFSAHVQMCYYLDDIEQIEKYRNKREKEKDKETEEYEQESIEYTIGISFASALTQMVEIEEIVNQK